MTFLAAGHETTGVALSWALHILAQHSDEQDLLREELVKAFPDKLKFNPTFDEINSLEYLSCIIKETLRLFPPGMFTWEFLSKIINNFINIIIFFFFLYFSFNYFQIQCTR
jgi:cytochrome P450